MITTALAFGGAILLAIGIFGIFLLFNSRKGGKEFFFVLATSLAFIIIGGYLVFGLIGIGVIIRKLAGIFLILVGVFLVVKFPGGYLQIEGFTKFMVLIGLIIIIFGIYLALF